MVTPDVVRDSGLGTGTGDLRSFWTGRMGNAPAMRGGYVRRMTYGDVMIDQKKSKLEMQCVFCHEMRDGRESLNLFTRSSKYDLFVALHMPKAVDCRRDKEASTTHIRRHLGQRRNKEAAHEK
jgi:hypothetical protein